MIKSKGNYIAVKVPEGVQKFELTVHKLDCIIDFDAESERIDLYEAGCTWSRTEIESSKIIGLVSEVARKEDLQLDEFSLCQSIIHYQWNQWLIIKKNN